MKTKKKSKKFKSRIFDKKSTKGSIRIKNLKKEKSTFVKRNSKSNLNLIHKKSYSKNLPNKNRSIEILKKKNSKMFPKKFSLKRKNNSYHKKLMNLEGNIIERFLD